MLWTTAVHFPPPLFLSFLFPLYFLRIKMTYLNFQLFLDLLGAIHFPF